MTQLALNVRLRDGSSFENYYNPSNREAVAYLRMFLSDHPGPSAPPSVFLWGEAASGKTHLLEAACRTVQALGGLPFYLPLAEPGLTPAVLEEAEQSFLVCLDDLQCIAGNAAWESALFARYELARTTGTRLIATATAAPMHLGFTMPELATRFAWGGVYQLQALDDDGKLAALQLRARHRGFDLPREAALYVLRRYPRDLNALFALLDRIDVVSLAHQRRVTVPFLRRFLGVPRPG